MGLLVAGGLIALVPPQQLAALGSGLWAMLVMAVIGIPLYMCATAATPIAAGLLLAGVSPGTVLIFLIAALVTSLAAERIEQLGGRPTFIDLRDHPMPLYDGDLEAEQSLPENALLPFGQR